MKEEAKRKEGTTAPREHKAARQMFPAMSNIMNIAISENSLLLLKCEAVLEDVANCIEYLRDLEIVNRFSLDAEIDNAAEAMLEARCKIVELHDAYSEQIKSETHFQLF